jgi:hypothetical protein
MHGQSELRDIVASKAPLIVDGKIVGLVGSFERCDCGKAPKGENRRAK